ncbi:hypothetical protein ACOMHN_032317 [Nucella lapillus]
MSGVKRLAKRSIIGTRVCALWPQDGRYHPGVIRAVAAEATPATDDLYTVHFDNGLDTNVTSKHIVGQGFQSSPLGRLKHDQKVFITLHGREVSGSVAHHDRRTEEVIIIIKQGSDEEQTISRKVDEVRLLESRKSARLVDQATDYSKLADRHRTDHKKGTVSLSIDVPAINTSKQRQRHASCGEMVQEKRAGVGDVGMKDETIAAMALTSLSVSPKSPSITAHTAAYDSIREHSYVSSSNASSGFYSGQSERGDPSPPHSHLSESAPASFDLSGRVELSSDSDTRDSVLSDVQEQISGGVKYRCIWRGCCSVFAATNQVERHIRRAHLDRDSDIELSDNEEEFYYEEIDEDELLDSVTESFAGMLTSSSSPPQHCLSASFETPSGFDHDYLRKDDRSQASCQSSSLPSAGALGVLETSTPTTSTPTPTPTTTTTPTIPITIPEGQIKRSLSWQVQGPTAGGLVSPPHRTSKPTTQERLQMHQAQSPKSHMLSMSPIRASGPHRKPRSEVRKCRKVYGMDNRDQWCTQCKWKKACTRFLD